MNEPPPASPPPYARRRLPFEAGGAPSPWKGAGRPFLFIITLMMIGLAIYMGAFERHPLLSAYVLAPAVGAVWFGIRLFISFAPDPTGSVKPGQNDARR